MIEVKITSRPSEARVYVDDKFLGRTPLTTEIVKGEHNIKLDYETGYITIDRDIYVSSKNNSFHFRFQTTAGKKFETAFWLVILIAVVLWATQPAVL